MDARARKTRVRARVDDGRYQLCGSDGDVNHFFTLLLNTDIVVSDFEEHLKHGLGKNATNTDIWPMAVYCEEEDLKRNRRRGWLVPKNP